MVNGFELKKRISMSGIKLGYICKKLGITRVTFRGRLNGKTEFTAKEIKILSEILGLSASERDRIFFRDESDFNSRIEDYEGR